MKEAGMTPSRVLIWSQFIGTAVATTLVDRMASLLQPVFSSGLILGPTCADIKTLTSTYRVAGTIPLLEPVARYPRLLNLLNTSTRDKWKSAKSLASFVSSCERVRTLPRDEGGKMGHY